MHENTFVGGDDHRNERRAVTNADRVRGTLRMYLTKQWNETVTEERREFIAACRKKKEDAVIDSSKRRERQTRLLIEHLFSHRGT